MTDECANTDRELWRGPDEGNGSYYADSVFVTKEGAIGMQAGGRVVVRSIRDWIELAWPSVVNDAPAYVHMGPAFKAYIEGAAAAGCPMAKNLLDQLDNYFWAFKTKDLSGYDRARGNSPKVFVGTAAWRK